MENERTLTCGFTGHRDIKRAHLPHVFDLVLKGIEYAYSEGCRVFLAGGAVGFDTVAAKAAVLFRMSHPDVRLELILPCKSQSDAWGASDRSVYEYLVSEADLVEYVSEEYYDGCMKERNRRLVERSDILIAYAARGRSGTGQTLRLAKEQNKRTYNIYPKLDEKT